MRSQRHQAVRKLTAEVLILLSGTPLQNDSQEVRNLGSLRGPDFSMDVSRAGISWDDLNEDSQTQQVLREV